MTETVELEQLRRLPHEVGDCGASIQDGPHLSLLCRVRHDVLCALPIEHVEETMRPLAVEALAGLPSFIQGLTVVRGVPTPVVNMASLLSGETSHATRFVTAKMGARRIVLAVEAVVGVVEIPLESVDALPPLLQNGELDAISAMGILDGELLLILRSTRLIPADVWATIRAGGAET